MLRRPVLVLLVLLVMLPVSACSRHSPPATRTPIQRWLSGGTAYIAHRGGDRNWPEGTAFAYAQAAAWNPNLALEVPVWPTSDGIWVVSEDASTGRVFDKNYTITTTPWSILSALRTRHGSLPMARLSNDVLDTYGHNRILFIDDKPGMDVDSFFAALVPYKGKGRFIIKSYWSASALPRAAHARGYQTWGYYYASNMTHFASTQSRFDFLGLNYGAPASAFATMRATGKPVIAHVVATAKAAQTALADGASALMVSGVEQVVPRSG